MTWTIVLDDAALTKALKFAKGTYHRDLLLGNEAWSGSTLKGKAKKYGSSYARSRQGLLERLTRAGIEHRFEIREKRNVLVLGRAPQPTAFERVLDEPAY